MASLLSQVATVMWLNKAKCSNNVFMTCFRNSVTFAGLVFKAWYYWKIPMDCQHVWTFHLFWLPPLRGWLPAGLNQTTGEDSSLFLTLPTAPWFRHPQNPSFLQMEQTHPHNHDSKGLSTKPRLSSWWIEPHVSFWSRRKSTSLGWGFKTACI